MITSFLMEAWKNGLPAMGNGLLPSSPVPGLRLSVTADLFTPSRGRICPSYDSFRIHRETKTVDEGTQEKRGQEMAPHSGRPMLFLDGGYLTDQELLPLVASNSCEGASGKRYDRKKQSERGVSAASQYDQSYDHDNRRRNVRALYTTR